MIKIPAIFFSSGFPRNLKTWGALQNKIKKLGKEKREGKVYKVEEKGVGKREGKIQGKRGEEYKEEGKGLKKTGGKA